MTVATLSFRPLMVATLLPLIALSRAGSALFWAGSTQPASTADKADPIRLLAVCGLLLGSVVLVLAAQPITAYLQATADQLLNLQPYLAIIPGGEA